MSEVIVITSGKGGVGKTTTTANIGTGLAKMGKKVVMIDTDIGLRNLDVVMGLENRIVYNLVDVIEGNCRVKQAMIKDKRYSNLFLLPSAQTRDKSSVNPEQMKKLVDELRDEFDYILLDCPAGIEQGFKNAISGADRALIVTTPEVSAIRDADRIIGLLEANDLKRIDLVINRIRMDISISWCEDFLFNLEYIRHASSFYALQVPIYYYVKRKGSLVSQGMSISNTMRMKINIFDYYNEFYKDVYDHEDYADIRLQVYSFFWAAAKDGGVPPAPLPGGRKLGEERPRIRREQVEGEGSVMDQYRYRQLLDYQLDLAAKKTRLTSDEAKVLFVLYQCGEFESMRRLSEVADLPLTRLFLALQKLERKKLVELSDEKEQSAASGAELTPEGEENGIKGKWKKEKKEKKKTGEKKQKKTVRGREEEKKERNRILLRPEAETVCEEFGLMQEELKKICFAGFSEEERKEGEKLLRRLNDNMIRFMVKEEPVREGREE